MNLYSHVIDSIQFSRDHMYDSRPDRKLSFTGTKVYERTTTPMVEILREHLKPGVWYSYEQMGQLIGKPATAVADYLRRYAVDHLFENKHEGTGRKRRRLWCLLEAPHEVDKGWDHSLLAQYFPKYAPQTEEEETCI